MLRRLRYNTQTLALREIRILKRAVSNFITQRRDSFRFCSAITSPRAGGYSTPPPARSRCKTAIHFCVTLLSGWRHCRISATALCTVCAQRCSAGTGIRRSASSSPGRCRASMERSREQVQLRHLTQSASASAETAGVRRLPRTTESANALAADGYLGCPHFAGVFGLEWMPPPADRWPGNG